MLLTIDAGNTRTKWALFNAVGEMSHQSACLNSAIAAADFPPPSAGYQRIVISNVAGEQHANLLAEKLAHINAPICWINASLKACNVFNRYAAPESLGSDRWAALIAAWHIKNMPCVVVNAGTAATIDALSPQINHPQYGEFIGGMIMPGLDLMQQSLGLATAKLPKVDATQNATKNTTATIFATNTSDAIYAGALNAIAGAVERITHTLTQQCGQVPHIILSGGNAYAIQGQLINSVTNPIIIVDNLVLQGLYLLKDATSTNSTKSETQ